MRTLQNTRDRNELLERMLRVGPNSEPRWGKMSAHQMICHLNDSLRAPLGEKYISPSTSLFKRAILKHLALWAPIRWPHGFKTRPEMDQDQGGTPPVQFASDLAQFRNLFERFCIHDGEFAPHAMGANVEARAHALCVSPHRSSLEAVRSVRHVCREFWGCGLVTCLSLPLCRACWPVRRPAHHEDCLGQHARLNQRLGARFGGAP